MTTHAQSALENIAKAATRTGKAWSRFSTRIDFTGQDKDELSQSLKALLAVLIESGHLSGKEEL